MLVLICGPETILYLHRTYTAIKNGLVVQTENLTPTPEILYLGITMHLLC